MASFPQLQQANSTLSAIRELLSQKSGPPSSQELSVPLAADRLDPPRPVVDTGADEGLAVEDEDPLMLEPQVTTIDPPAAVVSSALSPVSDFITITQAQSFDDIVCSSASASLSPQTAPPDYSASSDPRAQPPHLFPASSHVLDHVTSWWLDPSLDIQRPQYYDQVPRGSRPEPASAPWPSGSEATPAPRPAPGPGQEARSDDKRPFFSRSPAHGVPQTDQSRHRTPPSSSASVMTLGNLVDLLGQSDSRQWDDLFTGLSTFNLARHYYAVPPRIVMPPPARDSSMHHILHVARTNLAHLASPDFRDFLLRDTPNPLSREIKAFADPMRRMNKASEYLAVYWVLYLLFRVRSLPCLLQSLSA